MILKWDRLILEAQYIISFKSFFLTAFVYMFRYICKRTAWLKTLKSKHPNSSLTQLHVCKSESQYCLNYKRSLAMVVLYIISMNKVL